MVKVSKFKMIKHNSVSPLLVLRCIFGVEAFNILRTIVYDCEKQRLNFLKSQKKVLFSTKKAPTHT